MSSTAIWRYAQSEPGVWTVGRWQADNDRGSQMWIPVGDYATAEEAAARVAHLNRGMR